MRRIVTGLLSAALVFGLAAWEPAQAKVYKMAPEERAAALKEKKAQRKSSKKTGKPVPGQEQGGWVEMKPGEKIAKKNRKSKVDELAKTAEDKGKKGKKSSKEAVEAPAKPGNKAKSGQQAKTDKAGKGKKAAAEEIVVEKKGARSASVADKKPSKNADKKADQKAEQKVEKKSGRKTAAHGDRVVGSNFTGERKVSASSTEVRRSGAAPAPAPAPASKADDLSSYSVSRPGQEKAPVVPEVRQEVQPGPVDAARPVGSEHKTGEGRF